MVDYEIEPGKREETREMLLRNGLAESRDEGGQPIFFLYLKNPETGEYERHGEHMTFEEAYNGLMFYWEE